MFSIYHSWSEPNLHEDLLPLRVEDQQCSVSAISAILNAPGSTGNSLAGDATWQPEIMATLLRAG